MGYVGAGAVLFYFLAGLWVHCTLHEENTLSLNLDDLEEGDSSMEE